MAEQSSGYRPDPREVAARNIVAGVAATDTSQCDRYDLLAKLDLMQQAARLLLSVLEECEGGRQ